MSKKALFIIIAAAFALTAIGVMAQDNGPGVINVILPDGKSVPVFTDGRLNAFDIAAPVVVYYTASNGSIVNPNYTSGGQPDLTNLNFTDSNTMNAINGVMNDSNNASSTVSTAASQSGLINQLEVLAVGSGGSTGLILNASVDDLLSLVTGQQGSLSTQGYSVNFDPKANYFWVQAPADFEGKVYTFAWPNNLFPTTLIGQKIQVTTTQMGIDASNNMNANSSNANSTGSTQATTRPTTQPTSQPAATSTP